MCGIVGFISKEKNMEIGALIMNAYYNKHRGDEGIGILYKNDGKIKVKKYLNKLSEMYNQKLEETLVYKLQKIGSFIVKTPDIEKIKEEREKWENEIKKLSSTISDVIFIHHRKATHGAKTLNNLHPIEYNGKYYIHNGTISPYSIKALLELDDIEFNTDTDTEVLASIYNFLKEKKHLNNNEIFYTLRRMFPEGFGVLIEIDGDNVTLIKDFSRPLWMYEDKYSDRLFISEPTPLITSFSKLIMIDDGIFDLRGNVNGIEYTDYSKQSLEWWKDLSKSSNLRNIKCDFCNTVKESARVSNINDLPKESISHYNLQNYKDICYSCLITTDPSKIIDNDDLINSEDYMFEELLISDSNEESVS